MANIFYNPILSIVLYYPRIESDTYKLYPVFVLCYKYWRSYILRGPQKYDKISSNFTGLLRIVEGELYELYLQTIQVCIV